MHNGQLETTLIWLGILLFLVLAPGITIAIAWYRKLKQHPKRSWNGRIQLSLALQTLSFVWLLAGLVHGTIIGPDYSTRRFAVICGNITVAFLSIFLSASAQDSLRSVVAAAGGAVAFDWLYLAAVSSAV